MTLIKLILKFLSLDLRAAMKGGRWGSDEAAEVMIQCAARMEKQRKDTSGFNTNWAGSVEDNHLPILERLGIGLEHVGRHIRKLDYAREILGGSWRRNNPTGKFNFCE